MSDATRPAGAASLEDIQRRFPILDLRVGDAQWSVRDTAPSGGVPLVLLPGAGGTGDVFYRVMDAMAGARRLISVTYPALDDARSLASGIWDVLTALDVPEADLLGSSLGGYLAQSCTLLQPQRIRRAMFANTFYDSAWLRVRIPPQEWQDTPADVLMERTLAGWRAFPEDSASQQDLKQTMLALVGTHQTADMAKSALLAVLRAPVLPKVTLPKRSLALLDADDDPVVDADTRVQMRERYADHAQYRLPSGGHYPSLLNPTAYIDAVTAHFN